MIKSDGFSNISSEQWKKIVLGHVGQNVGLERVTYSEDFRGDITASFAASVQILVYFTTRSTKYYRAKEGYIERSPAIMCSKLEDEVKKGDRVTVDNVQYKVKDTINRKNLFITSHLYLWGDE